MTELQNKAEPGFWASIRLWGRYSGLGAATALIALAADQLHKYWMIAIYGIGERGHVHVTSFLDLVMLWNPGISYGLLPQNGAMGRIALLAVSLIAVSAMLLWMGSASSRLVSISLGLIAGGALGNMVDRIVYGAVADFFSFHYAGFYWYVFNIADVAITAGVIGLFIDWLGLGSSHTKVLK
jgi:signal peptidase II